MGSSKQIFKLLVKQSNSRKKHVSNETIYQFAELETYLGETERTRIIYEEGINQPNLDMPDLLWKSYIDFEISEKEIENARALYERLLQKTVHFKVSAPASI